MNKELEEAIGTLKELKMLFRWGYEDKSHNDYKIQTNKRYYNTMQIILKELKILQEENKELKLKERNRHLGKYGEIEIHELINKTLQKDYIPKDKIREKIEQLNKNRDMISGGYAISILQELLEGG